MYTNILNNVYNPTSVKNLKHEIITLEQSKLIKT